MTEHANTVKLTERESNFLIKVLARIPLGDFRDLSVQTSAQRLEALQFLRALLRKLPGDLEAKRSIRRAINEAVERERTPRAPVEFEPEPGDPDYEGDEAQ